MARYAGLTGSPDSNSHVGDIFRLFLVGAMSAVAPLAHSQLLSRMEPVKWPSNLHQLRPLRLESLPDRAVGELGMLVRFGEATHWSSNQAFSSS